MQTLADVAQELGAGLDELISFDRTLVEEYGPMVRFAMAHGAWSVVWELQLTDEHAQFLVDAWRAGEASDD